MPELSDALHDLYEAEARVQVSPSRAMNTLTGEARSARRRAQLRVGALAACGALVIGVGVTAGAMALKPQPIQPGATPSLSASTISVTWDPTAAIADATAGFHVPKCGDAWAPTPTSVGGVTLAPQAQYWPLDGDGRDSVSVATSLHSDGPPVKFLADTYAYVITHEGVVVAAALTFENLDLTGASSEASTQATMFASDLCAAQDAAAEAWRSVGLEPNATDAMTDAQKAAIQPQLDDMHAQLEQIRKDYKALPSGTYQVYAVTPIVFGEQLAAAQAIAATGYFNPGYINTDIGSTVFRNDPRISPYCSSLDGSGFCDVPQDVLREVLTFTVDEASVDTTPSGVAISEPVTVTVP